MLMPQKPNDFDELYFQACSRMTPQEQMDFVLALCGSMSPYLDAETTEHCVRIAETIVATDLLDRLTTRAAIQ